MVPILLRMLDYLLMNMAPIILFVYNRREHVSQTIQALQRNDLARDSDLFIFSDAPKNEDAVPMVEEVRTYIRDIGGFKSIQIVERGKNYGLAKNIIDGVTTIVDQYGRVIVLEDDIVISPYFLRYMNDALRVYESEERVISIHGYTYPVKGSLPETFFLRGADCWGWATWKRGWDIFEPDGEKLMHDLERKKLKRRFDLNGAYSFTRMLDEQIHGKNDSWAILWYASALARGKFTLYPGRSLVQNIGTDGSGTHCGDTNFFTTSASTVPIEIERIPVEESSTALREFEAYLRSQYPGLIGRARNVFRGVLSRI